MNSSKVTSLAHLAELYTSKLTVLRKAFRQAHADYLDEPQNAEHAKEIGKVTLQIVQVQNFINELKKIKHDQVVIALSVKCTALLVETLTLTTINLDKSFLPIEVKQLIDADLVNVLTHLKKLPFDDVAFQRDVYTLFMAKRELMYKKNDKTRTFNPIIFLSTCIESSSHSYIKLVSLRRLYFEYVQSNPNLLSVQTQRYAKTFEDSYKKVVAESSEIKRPSTLDEYHRYLDSISSRFIYYQTRLVTLHVLYGEKSKKSAQINYYLNTNNLDNVVMYPVFKKDFDENEIVSFINKERLERHELQYCLAELNKIDYSQFPRDYVLISRLGDIFAEGKTHTMNQSNAFATMSLASNNKKYSNHFQQQLSEYCQELKEMTQQWLEPFFRYENECLAPSVQIKEQDLVEKPITKLIEEEKSDTTREQDEINKKLDAAIAVQTAKTKKLKEMADSLANQISSASTKRTAAIKEIPRTTVIVEVIEEESPDLIILSDKAGNDLAVRHLEILDQRLTSFGRGLAFRVKTAYQLLLGRVQAKKKAMGDNGMNELHESIRLSIDDLCQLINLRSAYLLEIARGGELSHYAVAIKMSITDIDSIISTTQSLLVASMELIQDIVNRSLQRLKEITDKKVMSMGWEKFSESCKTKRDAPSNLTIERKFLEGMINEYKPKIYQLNEQLLQFGLNQKVATVELQEMARRGFIKIQYVPGKSCLVGGAAIKIIKGLALSPSDDMDFASSCSDASRIIEAAVFHISENNRRLFQIKERDLRIDLYAADPSVHYKDDDDWIIKDAQSRNFTICAVYIDYLGNVFDPTGRGLADIKKNILSAVADPVKLLKTDATNIFSAFKKMVEGYNPDPKLAGALQNWDPENKFNCEHLYAVVRKHLKAMNHEQCIKYVSNIFKYNIHEKIFGIRSVESNENLLVKIKALVDGKQSSYQPTLFGSQKSLVTESAQLNLKK